MMCFKIPRDPAAFSLDRDRKSRGGRRKDVSHLAFVRSLPCTVCASRRNVESCHIRFADSAYGKGNTGMATKPDDIFVVPLCAAHHRTGPEAQHSENEQAWWAKHGIDPLLLALKLRGVSGDEETAEALIAAARKPKVKA